MSMEIRFEPALGKLVQGGFVFRSDCEGGVYLASAAADSPQHKLSPEEISQLQAVLACGATGDPGPAADCLSLHEVAVRFGLPQYEIQHLEAVKLLDKAPIADHYTVDSVSRLSWQRRTVVDLVRKGGLGRSAWLNSDAGQADLVKLANDLPLTVYQRGLVSLAIVAAKGDSLAMPDMYFAKLAVSLVEHYKIAHLPPKCRLILSKLSALAKGRGKAHEA